LPLRNFVFNNIDSVFCISDFGIKYLRKELHFDKSNIQLSRLGVLKNIINPISSNNKIVVSCSNIIKLKRVELIAEALAQLNISELKWVHFGDKFGDDHPFEKIKEYCQKFLKGKVDYRFMGNVPNKSILDFYKFNSPSLFINVSSTEGVPVSIMEAMSFGIPVIASDVGGVSEIVNNKNGFLLSKNPSPNEISSKIKLYFELSEKEKLIKSNEAYHTWNTEFNADENYTNFCSKIC